MTTPSVQTEVESQAMQVEKLEASQTNGDSTKEEPKTKEVMSGTHKPTQKRRTAGFSPRGCRIFYYYDE
jgi:hypothetical protein